MEKLFFLVFIFSSVIKCNAQFLSGFVYDKDTNEPMIGVNVIAEGTYNGTSTNLEGKFVLPWTEVGSLHLSFISYLSYTIKNIEPFQDTLFLGKIYFLNKGASGYATVRKKRFLSKKEYYKCEYFDTRKKLNKNDFQVMNKDGTIRFVWQYDESNSILSVNFQDYIE